MVNAYTLTFAVLLITGAALGDRFGRKRVFLIGMGIFIGGSALAALSPSTDVLILARAIQGVGGAIVTPLTLTILSAAMPPERRAVALGAWGGIAGLAIAIGPLVGGAIAEGLDWHWIFWLNVPIGLVVLPLAALRLTESLRPGEPARRPGPGPDQRRPAGPRVGRHQRQRPRLGQHPGRRGARRRDRAPRRLRRLGGPPGAPDAADELLPQPGLQRRQRRLAADVLRDVRLGLPARPVLPGRPGLQPVPGRSPDAAVDGDADHRRPDRRDPRRSHRRAPDPGHRDGPPGRRPRLAGGASSRRPSPTRRWSSRSSWPAIGMGLFFAPIANVVLSAVRPEQEGKASGATNTIREVGGVFGVAVLAAIFSANGDYGDAGRLRGRVAAGHRGRRRRRRARGHRRAVHPGTGRCPGRATQPAPDDRGRREPAVGRARPGTDAAVRAQGTRPDRSRTLPACPPSSATSRPPTAPTCSSGTGRSTRPRPAAHGPDPPWASVLLVHGLGEHSGRYEHVGDQLAGAGLDATAYDQRGNGGSGGRRGHVDRLVAAPRRPGRASGRGPARGRRPAGRPVRPLDRRAGRRRLPPVRPAEAGPRRPGVAGARLDPAGVEEDRSPASCRGSRRPRPCRTTSIRRRCRATPTVGEKAVADPASATVTTVRFGAEAMREQVRVRREAPVAGFGVPTLVLHGLDDGLVPATASDVLDGAPGRGAPDLPGPPPRAPQRARRPRDRRRGHRVAATRATGAPAADAPAG